MFSSERAVLVFLHANPESLGGAEEMLLLLEPSQVVQVQQARGGGGGGSSKGQRAEVPLSKGDAEAIRMASLGLRRRCPRRQWPTEPPSVKKAANASGTTQLQPSSGKKRAREPVMAAARKAPALGKVCVKRVESCDVLLSSYYRGVEFSKQSIL